MTRHCEFDLVPVEGVLRFSSHAWDEARLHLLDFQPANRVLLVGDPPSRIRVLAYGEFGEVAPAVLARVEELAGATLRLEPVNGATGAGAVTARA